MMTAVIHMYCAMDQGWVTGHLLWLVCVFGACCQLCYIWWMIMHILSIR